MKFTFRNLGPIEKANLELGDLTIIAGLNNTGKTYIAYALYGFLKMIPEMITDGDECAAFFDKHLAKVANQSVDKVAKALVDDQVSTWNIDDKSYIDLQAGLVRAMEKDFSNQYIHDVFRTEKHGFDDTSLRLEFRTQPLSDTRWVNFSFMYNHSIAVDYAHPQVFVHLLRESERKSKSEKDITPDHEEICKLFKSVYSTFLLHPLKDISYAPFILPSTRHSAPMFYREVDFARGQELFSQWHRSMGQNVDSDTNKPPSNVLSPQSLPIRDNIDFNRAMTAVAERRSNKTRNDLAHHISSMLGGKYISQDRQVRFVSSRGMKFNIPLHLASSSAWELSQLYFFLGYYLNVSNSNLLIIDEPESHLDTSNQIRLARLLALLINTGVKVLVTTHSDYLAKEINNLIMLSSNFKNKEEEIKNLGYKETDALTPDQVQAYIAQQGKLSRCDVNEFGAEMSEFDKTIRDINQTSRRLASRILIENARE